MFFLHNHTANVNVVLLWSTLILFSNFFNVGWMIVKSQFWVGNWSIDIYSCQDYTSGTGMHLFPSPECISRFALIKRSSWHAEKRHREVCFFSVHTREWKSFMALISQVMVKRQAGPHHSSDTFRKMLLESERTANEDPWLADLETVCYVLENACCLMKASSVSPSPHRCAFILACSPTG